MKHSLGTAAKATGISKSTIQRAIKDGKISAVKNANGSYEIEPAELHRVYPPAVSGDLPTVPMGRHATHKNADETAEIAHLKTALEGMERLCAQITGERDRVCSQLDSLRDENREQRQKLMAILSPPARVETAPQPATAKSAWWKFGKAT